MAKHAVNNSTKFVSCKFCNGGYKVTECIELSRISVTEKIAGIMMWSVLSLLEKS